jgi:hypothetical protein
MTWQLTTSLDALLNTPDTAFSGKTWQDSNIACCTTVDRATGHDVLLVAPLGGHKFTQKQKDLIRAKLTGMNVRLN